MATDEATALAEQFRLLGDPTRVRLLYALLEAGELCVADLATTVGLPENTVSQALRLLRTAGAVRSRRAGRRIYYAVHDEHVRLVLDLARQHVDHAVER
jgi:DNA-binding transcriptional ArsR family regulator